MYWHATPGPPHWPETRLVLIVFSVSPLHNVIPSTGPWLAQGSRDPLWLAGWVTEWCHGPGVLHQLCSPLRSRQIHYRGLETPWITSVSPLSANGRPVSWIMANWRTRESLVLFVTGAVTIECVNTWLAAEETCPSEFHAHASHFPIFSKQACTTPLSSTHLPNFLKQFPENLDYSSLQ